MKKSISKICLLSLLIIFIYGNEMFPCDYPMINRLTDLDAIGTIYYIISGKVDKVERFCFLQQTPVKQFKDHSWDYSNYVATVDVMELIRGVKDDSFNPQKGTKIKIALKSAANWDYDSDFPLRLFPLRPPSSAIFYLKANNKYIFYLAGNGIEKRGFYSLYSTLPPFNEQLSCIKFYVFPIEDNESEIIIPVQYYGHNEIIKTTYSRKDFIDGIINAESVYSIRKL